MTLSAQERQSRRDHLLSIGFSEIAIEKLEKTRPQLYSTENIDEKIKGLKDRGFSNPEKMIFGYPQILNYAFDNIDEKIKGLKDRGFSNLEKMIGSYPGILSHTFDNIDEKIKGLKDRGFSNPEKMIGSYPQILGLGFENIDEKIKMLDKIIKLYKLDLTPIEIIENNKNILGSKIDKLWVLARIIKETAGNTGEVDHKLINKLLFANLESVILASRTKENQSFGELLSEAKTIKNEIPSVEEKRELISELPEEDMVRRRFERGYPPKK